MKRKQNLTRTSDAKEFKSYGGTLSGGCIESFVSDDRRFRR
jgi:hypothetical protein